MSAISSEEIREKFLKYFESKDHLRILNSSIIPKNDPTLLFINAGMAPMKKFFTGEEKPKSPRLCNVQSCIRTIDLDSVGDRSHLTGFLMLGSWSIGDYFKEGAIKLAYEFLTKHLNIPPEKLYVTIFEGDKTLGLEEDNEAKKYWKEVGVEDSHIVPCPFEDNFWKAGDTGPCGPCTEVFYDTGEGEKYKYTVGGEFNTKDRYLEIWNAGVFMQYNRNMDGTYSPLKFKSIDTGAGLERLTMTLNGYKSVYDTDLLKPILEKIYELSNDRLSEHDARVITDHIRTICLILSEKLAPSNEGRGYVPRKLIRKCILLTTKINILNFDYVSLLNFVLDKYKNIFPLFKENKNFVLSHFQKEYEQFNKILISGLEKLNEIKNIKKVISKDDAFELVTTYGLPFDIVKDYAIENNLSIDEKGFEERLEEHKDISKKQSVSSSSINDISKEILNSFSKTEFNGYEKNSFQSNIQGIIQNKKLVEESSSSESDIIIITKETPFYAESGGQCADAGSIYNESALFDVYDVQKTSIGTFLHFVHCKNGNVKKGDIVTLSVDKDLRQKTANNHSAVHLLHRALRDILGNDVHQAGSKVDSERLRFDFNYENKISEDTLFEIERKVNFFIRENKIQIVKNTSLEEAIKDGAMALFETKYGDVVREVSFEGISKELCGGTHTSMTGNIGLFVILSVEGIGKGMKRISAVTGDMAVSYVQERSKKLLELSSLLKVKEDLILEKVKNLEEKLKNDKGKEKTKLDINDIKKIKSKSLVEFLFLSQNFFDKSLRDELVMLSDRENRVVVYLGGKEDKQLLVASAKVCEKECPANKVLKEVISKCNGKGGGSSRIATGGGVTLNEHEITEILNKM